jgi:hypothetical protein
MSLGIYFSDHRICFKATGDIKTSGTIKGQTSGTTASERDVIKKIASWRKYINPIGVRDVKILAKTTKARAQEEQPCDRESFEVHYRHFVVPVVNGLLTSIL